MFFNEKTQYLISELIRNRKALVFCDNGKKSEELKIYSKLIDDDDFILSHDYKRPGGVKESDIPRAWRLTGKTNGITLKPIFYAVAANERFNINLSIKYMSKKGYI